MDCLPKKVALIERWPLLEVRMNNKFVLHKDFHESVTCTCMYV